MITVADVMTRRPMALKAAATVTDAVLAMRERGISSVLILPVAGSVEYGIVTMRDIVGKVIRENLDTDTVRLGEIATWRLLTAQPAWSLQQAAEMMARAKVRRLPVVDGREIAGIISDTDIFTALVPRLEWEHMRQVRKERAVQRTSQSGPARIVADVMSSPALTIDPTATVERAVAKMVSAGISSLVATREAHQVEGIVTKRDIVTKLVANGQDPGQTIVERLMSSPVLTIEPEVTVQECSSRMTAAGVRRFPVVRRDRDLIGIISDSDILAATAARRWAGHRRGPTSAIVADVMRTSTVDLQPVWTDAVTPELSLWECAEKMAHSGVRELPVVQGGRIIGIISDGDILRAITERGGAH